MVAITEVACGSLVLLEFLTRPAVVPLIATMLVAIVTTKIPILLGQDLWIFQVRSLDRYGFWAAAHEMRTDWAMLLGLLFLLIVGAGQSVDTWMMRRSVDRV